MANQQLVDYIKAQRAAGVSKPDLDRALSAAGWPAQDVAAAFAAADGIAPAPIAAPIPAAAPMTARPAAQPLQQPAMTQPIMQTGAYAKPRRSYTMPIILGVIVLLAAAAVAAYMFVPQVRGLVAGYTGSAPKEEVATTTPNVVVDSGNGYSITLPQGVGLSSVTVLERATDTGEMATSTFPAGSMGAGGLFAASKIPFADMGRGQEIYDYTSCCSGTRYWFDASSTAFKAETIATQDAKTTYAPHSLMATTSAGATCSIARTIGRHTFYRIESGDEGVPSVYYYFLPTTQGYMLRFMTVADLDTGGADVAAALASLTLTGGNETTVQCL